MRHPEETFFSSASEVAIEHLLSGREGYAGKPRAVLLVFLGMTG
jgi:hypothetical protein